MALEEEEAALLEESSAGHPLIDLEFDCHTLLVRWVELPRVLRRCTHPRTGGCCCRGVHRPAPPAVGGAWGGGEQGPHCDTHDCHVYRQMTPSASRSLLIDVLRLCVYGLLTCLHVYIISLNIVIVIHDHCQPKVKLDALTTMLSTEPTMASSVTTNANTLTE